MKKRAIFNILIILSPALCFAQKRSKLYNISSSLNKSLKVASVKDISLLIFKVSSLNTFDIAAKDTIGIHLADGNTIKLICNKTSSFHVSATESGDFYNAAYATYTPAQAEQLKTNKIKSVDIAGMHFEDNIKENAIAKAISD